MISGTERRFTSLENDWANRHPPTASPDDDDDDMCVLPTRGEGRLSGDSKKGDDSAHALIPTDRTDINGDGSDDDDDETDTSDATTSDDDDSLVDDDVPDDDTILNTPSQNRSQAPSSLRNISTESGGGGLLRSMAPPPTQSSSPTRKEDRKPVIKRLSTYQRDHLRRITTFRAHGVCGHHRLSVVARDPHPRSDCIVYHSHTYDRRDGREYSDKKTYFMPASGTLLAASITSAKKKPNKRHISSKQSNAKRCKKSTGSNKVDSASQTSNNDTH